MPTWELLIAVLRGNTSFVQPGFVGWVASTTLIVQQVRWLKQMVALSVRRLVEYFGYWWVEQWLECVEAGLRCFVRVGLLTRAQDLLSGRWQYLLQVGLLLSLTHLIIFALVSLLHDQLLMLHETWLAAIVLLVQLGEQLGDLLDVGEAGFVDGDEHGVAIAWTVYYHGFERGGLAGRMLVRIVRFWEEVLIGFWDAGYWQVNVSWLRHLCYDRFLCH
jgi:hypothetical protein